MCAGWLKLLTVIGPDYKQSLNWQSCQTNWRLNINFKNDCVKFNAAQQNVTFWKQLTDRVTSVWTIPKNFPIEADICSD